MYLVKIKGGKQERGTCLPWEVLSEKIGTPIFQLALPTMLLLWRFSLIPDMVRVAVLMESREKPPLKYSPQTKSKLGNWGVRFETLRMLPEDAVFPGRESLIYSLLINTLLYGTLCWKRNFQRANLLFKFLLEVSSLIF